MNETEITLPCIMVINYVAIFRNFYWVLDFRLNDNYGERRGG
jgi:preprotein translocase subunit SecE